MSLRSWALSSAKYKVIGRVLNLGTWRNKTNSRRYGKLTFFFLMQNQATNHVITSLHWSISLFPKSPNHWFISPIDLLLPAFSHSEVMLRKQSALSPSLSGSQLVPLERWVFCPYSFLSMSLDLPCSGPGLHAARLQVQAHWAGKLILIQAEQFQISWGIIMLITANTDSSLDMCQAVL